MLLCWWQLIPWYFSACDAVVISIECLSCDDNHWMKHDYVIIMFNSYTPVWKLAKFCTLNVCRVCDFRFTFPYIRSTFEGWRSIVIRWNHDDNIDFKLCLVSMIRQSACIFITTFNTATSVLVVSLSLCHSCILKSIYFSIDSWIDMCSNYTIIVRLISIAF